MHYYTYNSTQRREVHALTIYITAVRLDGKQPHTKKIVRVKWLNCATGDSGDSKVRRIVLAIQRGRDIRVSHDGNDPVVVRVVTRSNARKNYLRTRKVGSKKDHLLSLPRF
jgi:hypothetical protein